MRLSVFFALFGFTALVAPASAGVLTVPTVSSYVWSNGDSKSFELSWNGSQAVFTVEDIGTATYDSLSACCTDTFDRVRQLYSGAHLTFTGLSINTMPIDTVFVDNLNLTLFKAGALDNIGVLSGTVNMQWDDPFARMAVMDFIASTESGSLEATPEVEILVPEPATLVLLGSGLLGASLASRRRKRNATRAAQ